MARSRGPIYVADNSPTAINDALQQLLFMIDELKGEHDNSAIPVGPHTHDPDDTDSGGPVVLPTIPAGTVDHDDLANVTTDQHHAKLHETLHREGGADELKLDDTGNPDDNTDNNATISAHGLLRKLDNDSSHFLDGTGNWSPVVATADEATDIENVEGDATHVLQDQVLAEYPALGIDTITFVIDGGGSEIADGIHGDLEIPWDCTIMRATLLADQSGSIVIDIWKDVYGSYPPTDADSITASAPPTITTDTDSQDSTLTGWTKTITAGQTLRFNVDSCTTITRCTLALLVQKL